jgi:hypothetical protein
VPIVSTDASIRTHARCALCAAYLYCVLWDKKASVEDHASTMQMNENNAESIAEEWYRNPIDSFNTDLTY